MRIRHQVELSDIHLLAGRLTELSLVTGADHHWQKIASLAQLKQVAILGSDGLTDDTMTLICRSASGITSLRIESTPLLTVATPFLEKFWPSSNYCYSG